jgi:hypothetical protein
LPMSEIPAFEQAHFDCSRKENGTAPHFFDEQTHSRPVGSAPTIFQHE